MGKEVGDEPSEEKETRRLTNNGQEGRGIVAADYTSKGLSTKSVERGGTQRKFRPRVRESVAIADTAQAWVWLEKIDRSQRIGHQRLADDLTRSPVARMANISPDAQMASTDFIEAPDQALGQEGSPV
ncbi:hypothetical protein NDU88_004477 [Pleurodeles waltl]|uniref:Uncharacterized protein n=1 Tax=Pleurodeles waltl TaxID=8319 RepID=A0AAV7VIX3_PLEWA|nr:hypothetical protein NDU88_004477 [Pleurodeles waltl]